MSPNPQEPDPLSAEEEAELDAEMAKYGNAPISGQGLEACLTCSLMLVAVIAVAGYFFR